MRRIITLLAFATLAGALVFGAAAALDVGSANLGSGSDTVAACDTTDGDGDGSNVDVAYDLDASDPTLVTGVTLTDVDTLCDGQTVYAVVDDGTNALTDGSGSTLADTSGTASVVFGSSIEASAIEGVSITITG